MNTTSETWTTQDLELFRDGEMPEAQRESLSEALRADPALRRRLAVVTRIDALVGRAIGEAPAVASGAPRVAGRIGWRAFAAVAAVLVVATAIIQWSLRGASAPAPSRPVAVVQDPEPTSIRVVWSIPVIAGSAPRAGAGPTPGAAPVQVPATLENALASGDTDAAAKLLAGAAPEVRASAYRRMGELIRSGAACERLLDSMEPSQQLAVCREWALEVRLRPVTFARLAKLGSNSELSLQYTSVVAALYEYPELRSWLRSYVGEPVLETVSRRRG